MSILALLLTIMLAAGLRMGIEQSSYFRGHALARPTGALGL
jgi:hypothetical protein